mmetsp:Transcript_11530/g.17287  ORF Transcript_11530/g.17287 Transcript_11530/m.17287 type:complete len:109 (+) Transcript_11530:38-364(+)
MAKRENVFEVSKYLGEKVSVKCIGGREFVGVLRGHDKLLNLVLDEAKDFIRDPNDPYTMQSDKQRDIGVVVLKGTAVMAVSPFEQAQEISNPFAESQLKQQTTTTTND